MKFILVPIYLSTAQKRFMNEDQEKTKHSVLAWLCKLYNKLTKVNAANKPSQVTQTRACWRDAMGNGFWKKILLFYKVHKIQSPHHGMGAEFDSS